MENIFNKITIPNNYFNSFYPNILDDDILNYLDDNLHDENNKLRWDLRNALTINANGEYI
jgi:hypothetical protein